MSARMRYDGASGHSGNLTNSRPIMDGGKLRNSSGAVSAIERRPRTRYSRGAGCPSSGARYERYATTDAMRKTPNDEKTAPPGGAVCSWHNPWVVGHHQTARSQGT